MVDGFIYFVFMSDSVPYTEASVCQPEKRIHDICFFHWYQEEFLTGKATKLDTCKEQWDVYQECLEVLYN